ncbi:hypothetical protein ACOME3_007350 [Neoechinorhynchus agilis]
MDKPIRRRKTIDEATKERLARENHCEIERRRRVKMTSLFSELCDAVPACSHLSRRPDKLTILRMAAQLVNKIKAKCREFMNEQQMMTILHEVTGGFITVIECENGTILFHSRSELILKDTIKPISSSVYSLIHPDDIAPMRQFLNEPETSMNRVELKNGAPRHLDFESPDDGEARGQIACRWKVQEDENYYMATVMNGKFTFDLHSSDSKKQRCFIAIASFVPISNPSLAQPHRAYMRHDPNGNIVYLSNGTSHLFGIPKDQLLNALIGEFCVDQDKQRIQLAIQCSIGSEVEQIVRFCRFIRSDGACITLDCQYKALRNPYSNELHYVIGTYCLSSVNSSVEWRFQPAQMDNVQINVSLDTKDSIDHISFVEDAQSQAKPVSECPVCGPHSQEDQYML